MRVAVRPPSFLDRALRAVGLTRASMSDYGPFKTDAGWSMVSGQSPHDYERTGKNLRILGFEGNAVVSACIRTIADAIAAVRLEVYRENAKGEKTPDPRHPAQLALDAPRVNWSGYRMRHHVAAHFVNYGNGFGALTFGKGPRAGRLVRGGMPTGLRLIAPERVDYVYLDAETQEPRRFEWTDRDGKRQSSDWADIVHFKDLSLTDSVFGFPRAAATLLDIATDGEASQYVRQVLKNDGSPRLVVGMKSVVTESQARAADERWHEKAVERGERGRVRFLPGVEMVEQIGFDLSQLEFPALRQVSREDICAAFGVDPRMIGIASAKGNEGGLSGIQYAEARRRLYLQTCGPIMTAIEAEFDLSFCPEFGDVKVRFSPEAIAEITENELETSTRIVAQLGAGAITREEARAALGRPEEMDPSHTLIGSISRIEYPVALQFAAASALPGEPNAPDPNAPAGGPGGEAETPGEGGGSAEGDEDAGPGSAAARQAPKARTSAAPVRSRVLTRGIVLTADQRDTLWRLFDTRATREEIAYSRVALLQFAAERSDVAAVFRQAANGGQVRATALELPPDDPFVLAALQRIRETYGPEREYHRMWLERYRALIGATFQSAGTDVAAGVGVAFDLENVRVQRAIQARAARLADHVTQTTAQQITAAVEAGRASGMSIGQIADLVDESVFASQAPARAMRIARTEVSGALNQGEYEAAISTGVIRSKSWLSQRDGDVRETHVACDSQGWIAMASAFSNGLVHPGDPSGPAEEVINCRCALLYSDEEPQ